MKKRLIKSLALLSILILPSCSSVQTSTSQYDESTLITEEQFEAISHKMYDYGYSGTCYLEEGGTLISESKYDFINQAHYVNFHNEDGTQSITITFSKDGNQYDYEFGSSDGTNWSYLTYPHDSNHSFGGGRVEDFYKYIEVAKYEQLTYNPETKGYDFYSEPLKGTLKFHNQMFVSIDIYHHEIYENEWIWRHGFWEYYDIGTTVINPPIDIVME